jgi:phage terminase large subunit-like protein
MFWSMTAAMKIKPQHDTQLIPIDFSLPEPNVSGKPFWMMNPVSKATRTQIEELYRRGRASNYLEHYAEACLEVVPAFHHRVICRAIDDLLADEYDVLVICTPPAAAKSTYTSHALAAYFLGRYPHENVIIATHTAELSERWSRKVRQTLGGAEHAMIFPASQLSKDSTAVSRWATTAGGELLAAGTTTSILGFRATLIIIDDPISGFEQAQNETQLKKIHEWYENDLNTRQKPYAKQVIICQRLSANDLAGYVMERNKNNPNVRCKSLFIPMECNSVDDPLGRKIGEQLWPEWFTAEMVADAKQDDFKWRTLYQQEPPSSSGSWVHTSEIMHRPTPDNAMRLPCYGLSDIALSVNSGDYTVHMIVTVNELDEWDIVHAQRDRVDPEQSAKNLVALAGVYKPLEWLIDDDNASKVFMPLVATTARSQRTTVNWKPMPIRGQDKETRAAATRGQFKRKRLFYPADAPFAKWLTKEILLFPNGMGDGVDDGIDTLSLMGRRMAQLSKYKPIESKPLRPTTSEMTLDGLFASNRSTSQSKYAKLRL